MFSLRTHAIICGALFALLFGIPIVGNALQAAGIAPLSSRYGLVFMIFYFGLFLAFGLSAIPVMVMAVLRGQAKIGDGTPFEGLVRHQNKIIWAMWILILAGTTIAIPAAIKGGLFDNPVQSTSSDTSGIADLAKSEDTLVARPGMTLDEMARRSTLKLDISHPVVSGGSVFDFQIPDGPILLRRCRYYFISTYAHDRSRIEAVNVGTLPHKVSRAQLQIADAELRTLLEAGGWHAGHEEYRTEEDQQLHGGATRGPEGRIWLKNGIVLAIGSRRMDDPVDGEDKASAGEWIQTVDLRAHDDYPYIERYAFDPASR
jgi:hypothetical protein